MAEAHAPQTRSAFTEGETSQPAYIRQPPSGQPVYNQPSGLVSSVEGQPTQYQPQQPRPQEVPPGISLSFDLGALLRTQVGCLKILEFFMLATAWGAALKYNEMFEQTDDRTSFFLGATICAWAVTILCIVNTILGATRDLCNPMDCARFLINIYVVLDIVIAVSSSLLADRANYWASQYHDFPEIHSNIIALYVAVAFGFLSCFVILVDLINYCKVYSFYRQQSPSGYQQFQNQQSFNQHPASVISFPAPE